jgi:hypothetical protein
MTMMLDAHAFTALEQGDRAMWRRLKAAYVAEAPPMTHGGVVARVWADALGREAWLTQVFQAVEVVALDETLGRTAGLLLVRADRDDAIHAGLAALANHGDQIVTANPRDFALLVTARERRVDVIRA